MLRMTMDFKSDLLAIQANSGDLNLCSLLLNKIANWNVSVSSEDKETVADLFYATLKAIQGTESDGIIEKFYGDTISAFENINLIAKTGKENSSLILIDFLNELYQRKNNLNSKIELSQEELLVLLSDLEPVKYIFKICDSDGTRFFPVNKLLGNIILDPSFINTKIEPYHINLIQLAVEMYKVTCEDAEAFKELIEKCNLKFINYLNGACIRVDTMDMCNFRNNKVMVFYDVNAQKVLIRHEDKRYFGGALDGVTIESEYNISKRPIGFFVELDVDGAAIDYSEAIKESPKEFLKLMYERKCKNILIEKMILRTSEGRYEPLNPFCINDKWVVKGHINGREGKVCPPDRIGDSIEEGRLQLISIDEKHKVIDQICFGLCMALLEDKRVNIDVLFDGMDDDWLQNIFFKNWARNSDNIIEAIEFVLTKYANDLDYCLRDDNIRTLEFDRGRIRDCLPYSFNLQWVYEELNLPKTPSIFIGSIIEEDDDIYSIDFAPLANKSLAKMNSIGVSNISSMDVELTDETDPEEFYVNGQNRFFVCKDGKWFSSSDLQNLYKLIVHIELCNRRMISREMNNLIHENAFDVIKRAMMLHKKELADISIKKIDIESLMKIRFVNNLLLNKIDGSNWQYYFDMFAKQQILKFSGIEHDSYFSTKENGILVVPKDRRQEDAVLRKVYENYIRVDAERDRDWWFSGIELTVKNNLFFVDGTKISKVRFLFDNTEHGTATIRTIARQLDKVDEWIQFENDRTGQDIDKLKSLIEKKSGKCQTYKCKDSLVRLPEIVTSNHTVIESCSYYGTNEGDKLIKDFLVSCGFEETEIFVYHAKEIINRADLVKEDCQKLNLPYADNIFIVIREFNMPKKYLLPAGAVGKADNVVTLLVKKPEI